MIKSAKSKISKKIILIDNNQDNNQDNDDNNKILKENNNKIIKENNNKILKENNTSVEFLNHIKKCKFEQQNDFDKLYDMYIKLEKEGYKFKKLELNKIKSILYRNMFINMKEPYYYLYKDKTKLSDYTKKIMEFDELWFTKNCIDSYRDKIYDIYSYYSDIKNIAYNRIIYIMYISYIHNKNNNYLYNSFKNIYNMINYNKSIITLELYLDDAAFRTIYDSNINDILILNGEYYTDLTHLLNKLYNIYGDECTDIFIKYFDNINGKMPAYYNYNEFVMEFSRMKISKNNYIRIVEKVFGVSIVPRRILYDIIVSDMYDIYIKNIVNKNNIQLEFFIQINEQLKYKNTLTLTCYENCNMDNKKYIKMLDTIFDLLDNTGINFMKESIKLGNSNLYEYFSSTSKKKYPYDIECLEEACKTFKMADIYKIISHKLLPNEKCLLNAIIYNEDNTVYEYIINEGIHLSFDGLKKVVVKCYEDGIILDVKKYGYDYDQKLYDFCKEKNMYPFNHGENVFSHLDPQIQFIDAIKSKKYKTVCKIGMDNKIIPDQKCFDAACISLYYDIRDLFFTRIDKRFSQYKYEYTRCNDEDDSDDKDDKVNEENENEYKLFLKDKPVLYKITNANIYDLYSRERYFIIKELLLWYKNKCDPDKK